MENLKALMEFEIKFEPLRRHMILIKIVLLFVVHTKIKYNKVGQQRFQQLWLEISRK